MPAFCETSFSRYTYAARTVVVGSILNGKLCMKDGCVRFFIVVSYRAHIHVTSKVEILEFCAKLARERGIFVVFHCVFVN